MSHKFFHCIFFLMLLVFTASCKTTSAVFFLAQIPPVIELDGIKKIAIIDRTKPRSGVMGVVEGIASREGLFTDHDGRTKLLEGLEGTLQGGRYFEFKKTDLYLKVGGGVFSSKPISWEQIDTICRKYDADAVLSIEYFDTDVDVNSGTRELTDSYGNKKSEIFAERTITVNVDFRLYNNITKKIEYDNSIQEKNFVKNTGYSEKDARSNFSDKHKIIEDISYAVGVKYASCFLPQPIAIKRNYYKRGSAEMLEASQKAAVGRWEEALVIWDSLSKSANTKIARMAAYNCIVAYEVIGRLDDAKDQAIKTYNTFKDAKANRYIVTLDFRISESKKLQKHINVQDNN